MQRVYLGLGANLDDPQAQLAFAVRALQAHSAIHLQQCSSLYASKPMGPQDQPDYINAVVAVDTELSPEAILDAVQAIEHSAGRVREKRWGPRTLDIDILLIDNHVIRQPRLEVPHPGIELREFVLIPLAEIAPQLRLPNGKAVAELAAAISRNGLDKIVPPVTMHS